jgi:hypothetical protein
MNTKKQKINLLKNMAFNPTVLDGLLYGETNIIYTRDLTKKCFSNIVDTWTPISSAPRFCSPRFKNKFIDFLSDMDLG